MARDPEQQESTSEVPPLVGLLEDFASYRTPTEADRRKVLQEGLVVVDANVLLDLYRYHSNTREDLLSVLKALGDRLWVPHQVAAEFWRNRESALRDLSRQASETVDALTTLAGQVENAIAPWCNRISLDDASAKQLKETAITGIRQVISRIRTISDSDDAAGDWDTNEDETLSKLLAILEGRVGRALSEQDLSAAHIEAERRIEAELTPGYKDKNKGDERSHGDYLVWHQALIEAQRRRVDVLLVTRDVKDDWWHRTGGQTRGPRRELVEEMKQVAGVQLHMMRTRSFLASAGEALRVHVDESSVKEVEQVDSTIKKKKADAHAEDVSAVEDLMTDQVKDLLRRRLEAEGRLPRHGSIGQSALFANPGMLFSPDYDETSSLDNLILQAPRMDFLLFQYCHFLRIKGYKVRYDSTLDLVIAKNGKQRLGVKRYHDLEFFEDTRIDLRRLRVNDRHRGADSTLVAVLDSQVGEIAGREDGLYSTQVWRDESGRWRGSPQALALDIVG